MSDRGPYRKPRGVCGQCGRTVALHDVLPPDWSRGQLPTRRHRDLQGEECVGRWARPTVKAGYTVTDNANRDTSVWTDGPTPAAALRALASRLTPQEPESRPEEGR